MKTFDFRISKKLTFFMFEHYVKCLYKRPSLFVQSVSRFQLEGSWGSRENISIRQMIKINYILKKDNLI